MPLDMFPNCFISFLKSLNCFINLLTSAGLVPEPKAILFLLDESIISGLILSFLVMDLIIEGTRERVQVFEGIVIKKQGKSSRKTFTVRRISYGIGVERTFLINSPRIAEIKVVRKGKVRRAKLYYLRDRQGKAAKVKEKINY